MLTKQPWMKGGADLRTELRQAQGEGKELAAVRERAARLIERGALTAAELEEAGRILDEIRTLPTAAGYPYAEPDALADIRRERSGGAGAWPREAAPDRAALRDRILGGWLGRCAGCLLGQPVEGWHRPRLVAMLKETGNYPIRRYMSSDHPAELREKYGIVDEGGPYGSKLKNWINNIEFMPEDDDINYTVVALKLLEDYGPDFTSADVAETWLHCLPLLHTCTAERIAYINLSQLILPPESAAHRNPYREWIGAQIRADLFGYVNPGDPERAADMAYRDAAISHVKNGIYGEMFAAAMIAAAFVTAEPEAIVRAGMAQIPRQSRLHERLALTLEWRAAGVGAEEAVDCVHGLYDETNWHDWTHTVSNAMIVAIGLLYGGMDFETTIGLATAAGFDTDCNAATVGSVIGVAGGASRLPPSWIAPLNGKLKSGVDGFGVADIASLAERTLALATR